MNNRYIHGFFANLMYLAVIHYGNIIQMGITSTLSNTPKPENSTSERLEIIRHQFVKEMRDIYDPILDGVETALENAMDKDFSKFTANMSSKEAMLSWYDVYKEILDSSVKRLLPLLIYGKSDVKISSECQDALFRLISDLRKGKMWTLKMLDASGKPGGGIFSGNTYFLGSYDQCLDISVDMDKGKILNGQYCLIKIEPPSPKQRVSDPVPLMRKIWKNQEKYLNDQNSLLENTLQEEDVFVILKATKENIFVLGLCAPSLCSLKDINAVLKGVTANLNIEISAFSCETTNDHPWTKLHTALSGVFGGLLLLVIIGTIVDYVTRTRHCKDQKKAKMSLFCELISCYSVSRNFRNLLHRNTKSTFSILSGLKAMTISWIILSHTYLFIDFVSANEKVINGPSFTKSLFLHGIINGIYTVDTFFLISAMLVSYSFLTYRQSHPESFPAFPAIVHRYLRLMPSVFAITGLVIFMPVMVSGPLATHYLNRWLYVDACQTYWWTNFLAVTNFMGAENMCLAFVWYICADLQLFGIFLIPVYILIKWPKKGTIFLLLLSLSFIGYNYYSFEELDFYSRYPPYSHELRHLSFVYFASRPNAFIPVYAIGVVLGYLLFYYKDVKINKVLQVAFWCMTFAILLTLTWITRKWQTVIRPPKVELYSLFLLGRTAWAIGISWIIYACLSGRGGFVNAILSSKVFVPFGKLTFSCYLMNQFVIAGRLAYSRNIIPLTHYSYICEFIVNLVFTNAAAAIFYLVVESPIASLQMHFLKNSMLKPSETKNVSGEMYSFRDEVIPKVDKPTEATTIT